MVAIPRSRVYVLNVREAGNGQLLTFVPKPQYLDELRINPESLPNTNGTVEEVYLDRVQLCDRIEELLGKKELGFVKHERRLAKEVGDAGRLGADEEPSSH